MFAEVNGVRIHYESAGEGRPLVLLHGNGEDMSIFDVAVEELKDNFRVITVDSRGHGLSQEVDVLHYSDIAEDVHCLIEALGLERPVLFGYSDGGIAGLILASEHPDDLLRLAVAGANTDPSAIDWGDELSSLDRDDPYVRLMLEEPHISEWDLRSIRVPTLVIAGEFDMVKRSDTEFIADRIPHGHMYIVPDEDHGSYVENSVILPRLLKDWLI
ncbi:MAG: alpha/beta hydrolase [Candidatus Methanomethylophilaceae archaeon]|nr:alpha/beta hydrolase [Candidatus Methanomethylophilaceae archaeon]